MGLMVWSMSRSQWRGIACLFAACLALATGGLGHPAVAQEPSAFQALVALEDVLVDLIARNEKSVVAIARIRRLNAGDVGGPLAPADLIRSMTPAAADDPTNPEFVPNDYGTGVVIDDKGLILTNYHVVVRPDDSADRKKDREVENELWVTTSERRPYRARIVAADPRSDLAVLSIDAKNLTPIKFGDARQLKKGQIVISLGNPYAIARDGQVSAAWGIVANLGRKAGAAPADDPQEARPTLHHYGTLIQTDAKLNLGTSGGPLLNLKGEMVGLSTSQAALAGYEQSAGYAIPVDESFRRVVDELKEGREVEYGFLGIAPGNLESREILAGAHGMRVTSVIPGMPAQRFGVRMHDVVLAVDGDPIFDVDGLMLRIGRLPAEAMTRLTVMRNGQMESLDVELGKYPVKGHKIVTAPRPAWRGLQVDHSTVLINEIRQRVGFGVGFPGETFDVAASSGVGVIDVTRDSPAWKAGLRPGMFISHVGGAAVQTPREFRDAVANKNGAVEVRTVSDPGEPVGRRTISAEGDAE